MTNFKIEIVSDTVCPWCYIGKKKLEKAIAEYKERHGDEDTFETTWLPFYLNPGAPKEGIDKQEMYRQRFGPDRAAMIHARIAQVGQTPDVSIPFKFGGRTGNTRNSHRLIQLGKTHSPAVQTRVIEELFKLYFENEGDITDVNQLKEAGVRAGLGKEEVEAWMSGPGDKGGKEVDREVEDAQRAGVSGVPNFTINGLYEVGGAQDREVFVEVFERIKKGEGFGSGGRGEAVEVC